MKDLVSVKISRAAYNELCDEQHRRKKTEGVVSQDRVIDGWLATSKAAAYPERTTLGPVPRRHTPVHELGLISVNPSQLSELRETLNRAIAVIDGVLTDGENHADTLGTIKAEIERTLADGGNPGIDSQDPAPARVTATKARRGH